MITGVNGLDDNIGTCHESWKEDRTQNADTVILAHDYGVDYVNEKYQPDEKIFVWINPKNISTIARRIVILDFFYANDPEWKTNGWAWDLQKHQRLAGPDWPDYSDQMDHYPGWCLDEMCQVAYERIKPWTTVIDGYEHVIDSNEIFGTSATESLEKCFRSIFCQVNEPFLRQWQKVNFPIIHRHDHKFCWTPEWITPRGWVSADDNGYSKNFL